MTGRLTSGRAALTGTWFGLLFGFLLGLFSSGSAGFGTLVGSVVSGAACWAMFAFLARKATRGRHDFTRVDPVEAEQYDVTVETDDAIRHRTPCAAPRLPAAAPVSASSPPTRSPDRPRWTWEARPRG